MRCCWILLTLPYLRATSCRPAGWALSRFSPRPPQIRLAVPAAWRAFNEFNVERLRRYLRRPLALGGDADEPPPVVAQDGSLEHEVAAILQFRLRAGRPQVLVRWAGQDASGESWEPLENLTNCEEAIAAFERSRGVKLPRRPPAPPSAVVEGVPPPLPPTGYTVDPAPGDLGRALVGRRILYWWGEDGWQLGSVARVSSQASFSHVVAYHRRSSALSGTAHSLLDATSYGSISCGRAAFFRPHCSECPFPSPHLKGAGRSNSRLGLSAGFEGCTRHPLRA